MIADPFTFDASTAPVEPTATPTVPTGRMPRWLRETSAHLGPAEYEDKADGRRRKQTWLWNNGDTGVIRDRYTHVVQWTAFSPRGSVTFRSVSEPTEAQVRAAVNLADLTADPWRAPLTGVEVRGAA
ncbi:MAG TPA: hypothetical protein VE326_11170 [Candidatus Binatia bacterium]|nr:hypothetical protein [Candidatus Binatia bacterium]